ncbi:MAG: DNA methyltransferase [Candidatus Magasanikbacteria bacterium]
MSKLQPLHQPAQQKSNNHNLLFILGRESLLSLAEVKAVFLLKKINFDIVYHKESKLVLSVEQVVDLPELMRHLGGTIKICEVADQIHPQKDELAKFLNIYIPTGKIEFSINGFSALGIEAKKILKELSRSARYIEANNTATVIYNNLIKKGADIEVCNNQVFITKAIQSIDDFSKRDFGRPGRDDESGMLPPKLAMMMINLAMQKTSNVIADPFCGSGTIITEAILMGYKNIIGSDISETAISDTTKNITWIENYYNIDTSGLKLNIFQSDIFDIAKKIGNEEVDAIIAESYLGKPLKGSETKSMIESQATELKMLYINSFSKLQKILKPGGIVIFVIPRFNHKDDWITMDCEKDILKLGFVNDTILPEHKHLMYWRSDQHVGREIWRFKKI